MRSWWVLVTLLDRLVDRIAPMRPGDQSRLDLLDRPSDQPPKEDS